jgi:general secretion pathway protein J
MRPRAQRSEAGFTLIEVMVSLAILVMMMTIAWMTTANTAGAKKQFEKYEERNHEIRIAMARMVRDLQSAYLSDSEDKNQIERRTLFIGKSRGTVDELRFSSLGHTTLWANAAESEQTLISYSAEQDQDDSSKTNLLRRESRRLSNEPWKSEKAEVDLLLRDIQRVSFEYWDWRDEEWRKDWNTVQADAQRDRLPTRVKIMVEVKAPNGDILKYTTQARLMMEELVRVVN